MKKYKHLIWITIVLVILTMWQPFDISKLLSFDWINSDKEDSIIENNQIKIDSLMSVIENNRMEQLRLDSILTMYNDSLLLLSIKVKERENKIKELTNQGNEISNIVAKFSTSDINKFLSERYKDSLKVE